MEVSIINFVNIKNIAIQLQAEANGNPLAEKARPILNQFADIAKIAFPVIFAVAAILIIVRLIFLAVKLSKSGDDPELRSKTIKGLIWWGVGLLICIAACTSVEVVFNMLANNTQQLPTPGQAPSK